jgi:hypothetical protein
MEKDLETTKNGEIVAGEEPRLNRREFFAGLGKWSLVVIGAALGGVSLLAAEQEAEAYGRAAWANRGGGGGGAAWGNRAGGGGAAWSNRGGGGGAAWANHGGGGTAWANRYGGAAWANRGTAWANHGSAWVNRW